MHQAKNYLQKVFFLYLFQKNEIRYEIGQHNTQLQNIHRSDFFNKKCLSHADVTPTQNRFSVYVLFCTLRTSCRSFTGWCNPSCAQSQTHS